MPNDSQIKPCLDSCQVQKNDFMLSQATFPHKLAFRKHKDLCLIMEKISRICKDPERKDIFEEYYKDHPTFKELIDYFEERKKTCGKKHFE